MNIWIVTQIYGSVPGGGGIAGYATYPGVFSTEVDGIVVVNSSVGLLAHEVGHYLWLSHTFEGNGDGSTCPPNNDCTIDGDQVCDTEPHYSYGCNNWNKSVYKSVLGICCPEFYELLQLPGYIHSGSKRQNVVWT